MSQRVEFENIEEMRRSAGIDDAELRDAIGKLQVGDLVKLTLRTTPETFPGEDVLIRITSIKGGVFRGKLAQPRRTPRRAQMTASSLLAFTRDQIHSIPTRQSGAAHS